MRRFRLGRIRQRTQGDSSPNIVVVGEHNTITVAVGAGRHDPMAAPPGLPTVPFREPYYEKNPLVSGFRRFMRERDRGYFTVEAEPGMGKTAFAIWAASLPETKAAHFVRYGSNTTTDVISHLCSQLVQSCGIRDPDLREALSHGQVHPAWLARVIDEAAAQCDGRLVIVLDGLDAADGHVRRGLPFGLPDQLPRDVYVVLTARNGTLVNFAPGQSQLLRLRPDSAVNRDSLRGFLQEQARAETLIGRTLADHGIADESFVDQLLQRSEGSWVYAHLVLETIARAPATVRSVPDLPSGLDAFYDREILALCRDSPTQSERIALLAALGTANEPLDADALCSLAGGIKPSLVGTVIQEGLRPFCDISLSGDTPTDPPRYALGHASLREYLSGSSPEPAPDTDALLRERIARACRQTHGRICDQYLGMWGGLASGLPTLTRKPELARTEDGYPLRHLVFHLAKARRTADLHTLLALSRGNENLWYSMHRDAHDITGYLRDLELARKASPRLSQQLRYRLLETSVGRAVTAVPPTVIGELVNRAVWTPEQAFQRVERMTDHQRQAHALLLLVDCLPQELLSRALALVPKFSRDKRSELLTAIAGRPEQDAELRRRVAELSLPQGYEQLLPFPMAEVVFRHLPIEEAHALTRHHRLADRVDRQMLGAVVDLRVASDRTAQVPALLRVVRDLPPAYRGDELLAALVPHLPSAAFDGMVADLRDLDLRYCPQLVSVLGTHLPQENLPDLWAALATDPWSSAEPPTGSLASFEPLLRTRVRANGDTWASLLCAIAPRLDGEDLWAALRLACLLDAQSADTPIRLLIEHLPPGEVERVAESLPSLAQGYAIGHILLCAVLPLLPIDRARAIAAAELAETEYPNAHPSLVLLAGFLSPESRRPLLENVSEHLCYGWSDCDVWRWALARIGQHLNADEIDLVLDATGEGWAWNPDARLMVIEALAPHLSDDWLRSFASQGDSHSLDPVCFSAVSALGRLQTPAERARTVANGLKLVRGTDSHASIAGCIRELAPVLPAEDAGEALDMLGSLHNPEWQVPAIEALSARLAPDRLPDALTAALESASAMPEWATARLPRLLGRLADSGHADLLGTLFIQHLNSRWTPGGTERFIPLISVLTETQAREGWNLLLAADDREAPEITALLIPRLAPADQPHATQTVLQRLHLDGRPDLSTLKRHAWTLGKLLAVPGATGPTTQALRRLLRNPEAQDSPFYQILAAIERDLPPSLAEEALQSALRESWEDFRLRAVTLVAPSLSAERAWRTIKAVGRSKDNYDTEKALALAALAVRCVPEQRDALLDSIA